MRCAGPKKEHTVILRTRGWAIISAVKVGAFSREQDTKFKTPSGKPASWKASITMEWHLGLYSEDLRTTVFPARIGAMTALNARVIGAFHGAMLYLSAESAST